MTSCRICYGRTGDWALTKFNSIQNNFIEQNNWFKHTLIYNHVLRFKAIRKKRKKKVKHEQLIICKHTGVAMHQQALQKNPPSTSSAPFSPTFFRLSHLKNCRETFPWDVQKSDDITGPSMFGNLKITQKTKTKKRTNSMTTLQCRSYTTICRRHTK